MPRFAIALGLLALIPGQASAGPVTWEFGGTVTFVSDSTGFLGGGVTLGSPFSLVYTFDSTTPDSNDDPGRGTYEDAITNLSGQVGDLAFLGPGVGDNLVAILDNMFGIDGYFASSIVDVLDEPVNLRFTMLDSSEFVFSDDSLPVVPPDLRSFDTPRFPCSRSPLSST